MASETESKIKEVLNGFLDPESGRSLTQMEQVHDLTIDGDRVDVKLGLTTHSAPLWDETRTELENRLREAVPKCQPTVSIETHERKAEPLGQIGLTAKTVIAVGSGKGGVGKSTISAALAWGLKRAGSKVGLMDADVYGPSIPHLLGLSGRPEVVDKRIQPADKYGLKVMSMGFLVPEDEAVVWRGPMLHGAITQFLRDTAWGQLDYLIIDMPPGTGDIALTLSQLLPLTGAVVVCTPQQVALLDAVKAIAMFQKVNIPVLGVVENMSGFVCEDCGKTYDLFGKGGAREKAEQLNVPFLGEVPINVGIREKGDASQMDATFNDPLVGRVFTGLSYQLVKNLATKSSSQPVMHSLPVL